MHGMDICGDSAHSMDLEWAPASWCSAKEARHQWPGSLTSSPSQAQNCPSLSGLILVSCLCLPGFGKGEFCLSDGQMLTIRESSGNRMKCSWSIFRCQLLDGNITLFKCPSCAPAQFCWCCKWCRIWTHPELSGQWTFVGAELDWFLTAAPAVPVSFIWNGLTRLTSPSSSSSSPWIPFSAILVKAFPVIQRGKMKLRGKPPMLPALLLGLFSSLSTLFLPLCSPNEFLSEMCSL